MNLGTAQRWFAMEVIKDRIPESPFPRTEADIDACAAERAARDDAQRAGIAAQHARMVAHVHGLVHAGRHLDVLDGVVRLLRPADLAPDDLDELWRLHCAGALAPTRDQPPRRRAQLVQRRRREPPPWEHRAAGVPLTEREVQEEALREERRLLEERIDERREARRVRREAGRNNPDRQSP